MENILIQKTMVLPGHPYVIKLETGIHYNIFSITATTSSLDISGFISMCITLGSFGSSPRSKMSINLPNVSSSFWSPSCLTINLLRHSSFDNLKFTNVRSGPKMSLNNLTWNKYNLPLYTQYCINHLKWSLTVLLNATCATAQSPPILCFCCLISRASPEKNSSRMSLSYSSPATRGPHTVLALLIRPTLSLSPGPL